MKTVDAESPQRPMTEEAGVSLNELAYRRFKQALVTLSYKPGEYLNTAQVMNDLDMGRTPINQAIHRLANEGLLQVIPRKGVMVSPLSMDDALELIEVRLANEMLCMRLASQKITERQIATLTELNRQIEAASQERDRVRMMTLDHEFHQELAQIAGNNMLADILSVLHARAQRFWASTLSREGHMREVIDEHRAIIAALAAQDSAAAAEAAQAHILSFRTALLHDG
ncbi:GntR family transcriptional regulator [Serratia marcescens subsp. marcescens ATCC 13880]|uniref:GntR family transcriptional regulator n=1 Tax=Serratia marcescens TaxID=615 RepID=A0A3E2EAE7_SERMA|nr:GntR family transcriptional regulator [Serratia marcescens]KFD14714.1 GntR family transcriptional regulator [Serratia marcescens subsp. marcescens ATCC 13880]MBL0904651.1 GntR family transcriptional regulator [Serratia bockelmannii]PIJ07447.1 GntR family transcriptional regulator [Serratia sp. OMLW3]PIJ20090.1 GntR family transcriptional regulator [Serratia sp. OLAL2]QHI79752.1 FCD domain-containing protein [Serratia sp. NGAS9]